MERKPYRGVVYSATSPDGLMYIGKSKHGLKYRRKSHETQAMSGKNTRMADALRRMPDWAAWVWQELYLSDDEEALYDYESDLIALLRAQGVALHNQDLGGPGRPGNYAPGPQNSMYGKSHSPEARAKIKAGWTEERRAAAKENMTGRVFTEEQLENIRAAAKTRKPPSSMPAWTPERRAKHAATLAAKKAAKLSQ